MCAETVQESCVSGGFLFECQGIFSTSYPYLPPDISETDATDQTVRPSSESDRMRTAESDEADLVLDKERVTSE